MIEIVKALITARDRCDREYNYTDNEEWYVPLWVREMIDELAKVAYPEDL